VNRVGVRRSFGIEAVYFPMLIFFLVFAVPALWRGLGRLGAPDWVRCGIVAVVANAAVGVPACLGHGPNPTTSGATDGTVVYHSFFLAVQRPTGVWIPRLLEPVVVGVAVGPAHVLACVFPPVLAGKHSWSPSSRALGRAYMLLPVWGCMFYGVAAMLLWCGWESIRERWRYRDARV